MPSKTPLSDMELEAGEGTRDIAAELKQSAREMLADQGAEIPVSPVVTARMNPACPRRDLPSYWTFRNVRCRNGNKAVANPRGPPRHSSPLRGHAPRGSVNWPVWILWSDIDILLIPLNKSTSI